MGKKMDGMDIMDVMDRCKYLVLAILVLGMLGLCGWACGQSSYMTTASLRSAALVSTGTAEVSTSTLPLDVKAVVFFVTFTKGSLTNAVVSPVGAYQGQPAGSEYFDCQPYTKTLTASGRYVFRVPREELGTYQYFGVSVLGTGTQAGSSLAVSYKFDYGLPN